MAASFVKAEHPAPNVQHCRWIAELAQAAGVVGVLDGHDLQSQPVHSPRIRSASSIPLVQKASGRLGARPGIIYCSGSAKVYPLRRAEVLQHPEHALAAHPLPGGQPNQ